ncbi:4-alpha-glucanotransferase [Devosia sp.]|uniref:4-alpha-glucanotransferase n=1 Tax=Devosia sp. TaxID=1871048 RepID=UPI003A9444DE
MSETLDALATRCGVAIRYTGLDGVDHKVPDASKVAILAAMGLEAGDDAAAAKSLTSVAPLPDESGWTPAQCYIPDWLETGNCWGVALQVYALRSARNWGIGDFADLAAMAETSAATGADFLGTNPLHAIFMSEPDRRSPFFPSTRRHLNPIYIAVDQVPGYRPDMGDVAGIAAARDAELVDYIAVAALKLDALRKLWPVWQASEANPPDYAPSAFDAFVTAGGESLRRHALFEALAAEMATKGLRSRWDEWPEALQDVEGTEVAAFAEAHADDVQFHLWLQWLASVQLSAAQAHAKACGMRIGLYLDFAVGEAPDGSATWGAPALAMRGVHIGAPPDYFSSTGQDWAIAPLSPTALRAAPDEAYGEMIASSMRYCGALRIDHAMGIRQLFLVPEDASPAAGAYVRYPTPQLVQALADTSHRYGTVVIGEDLGYVPEGFRDLMADIRLLSYRILYFERKDDGFVSALDYPREALACVATHDLPTIDGWWRAADVALRLRYGLIDAEAARTQSELRVIERAQLLDHLVWLKLLSADESAEASAAGGNPDAPLPASLVVAIHRFLSRGACRMLAVRIEDLVGETLPVNLPGTVDDYPNWKRKLAVTIEDIGSLPLFRTVTSAMAADRPRQS